MTCACENLITTVWQMEVGQRVLRGLQKVGEKQLRLCLGKLLISEADDRL